MEIVGIGKEVDKVGHGGRDPMSGICDGRGGYSIRGLRHSGYWKM